MIRPLADRLLVRPVEAPTATASGLILPDKAVEQPCKAEVIAVGPGVDDITTGEVVLYKAYAGDEVWDGDEPLLMVAIGEVLGVFSDGAP